jgi:hypothetical protein
MRRPAPGGIVGAGLHVNALQTTAFDRLRAIPVVPLPRPSIPPLAGLPLAVLASARTGGCMTARRVAIYLGRGDQLTRRYILSLVCDRWRDAGIGITVLDDPARRVDADAAIIHVDATRRATAYEAVLAHYPRVINGSVRDISKRLVSTQLLSRSTTYPDPVIVKTNGNCFGYPDADRRRKDGALPRIWSGVVDRLLPTRRAIRRTAMYPIFSSARQVPRMVWWDPRLVVERFLPERLDGFYCLRTWIFFGAGEKVSLSFSRSPVVKRANILRSEFVGEVPDEIREARRRLGFDYGKFDFVIHDGRPILLDANATPTCAEKPTPRLDAIADQLATGLFAADACPAGAR